MKLKGGWRYIAKLSGVELDILKTGLELLLDQYGKDEEFINTNGHDKKDVQALVNEIDENQ